MYNKLLHPSHVLFFIIYILFAESYSVENVPLFINSSGNFKEEIFIDGKFICKGEAWIELPCGQHSIFTTGKCGINITSEFLLIKGTYYPYVKVISSKYHYGFKDSFTPVPDSIIKYFSEWTPHSNCGVPIDNTFYECCISIYDPKISVPCDSLPYPDWYSVRAKIEVATSIKTIDILVESDPPNASLFILRDTDRKIKTRTSTGFKEERYFIFKDTKLLVLTIQKKGYITEQWIIESPFESSYYFKKDLKVAPNQN